MNVNYILEFSHHFIVFAYQLLHLELNEHEPITFELIKQRLRFLFLSLEQLSQYEFLSIQELNRLIDLLSYYDLKFITELKSIYLDEIKNPNPFMQDILHHLYSYDLQIYDCIDSLKSMIQLLELNQTLDSYHSIQMQEKMKQLYIVYQKISIFENEWKFSEIPSQSLLQQIQHSHQKINYLTHLFQNYMQTQSSQPSYIQYECELIYFLPWNLFKKWDDLNKNVSKTSIIHLYVESENLNLLSKKNVKNIETYYIAKVKRLYPFEISNVESFYYCLFKDPLKKDWYIQYYMSWKMENKEVRILY